MNRHTLAILVVALPLLTAIAHSAERHPNILLILADDFGVGDIQAHYPDNKIFTPHLDRLAREGTSFTDAHSPSSVCSPTRYGILTGRYAWRTPLQEWVIAAYEPPLISEDRPTLASFLGKHGYQTSCLGKWHLGWEWPGPQPSRMTEIPNGQGRLIWDFTKPIRGGPTERGFQYFFGVDVPNFPPFTFIENTQIVTQPSDAYVVDVSEGVVLPTTFVGAPAAPEWRFDEILPELTRRAVQEIHDRASVPDPFFLFFSMTSPHEPIVPSRGFRGESGIAPIADFVMETDWSVGQLLKAIDDAGIREETIVIFTADNGHSHYTGWDQLVAAGHLPSGPFRGHKGDIWEGGHRVPLIIRWPEKIVAGHSNRQLISLTDIFATCAELLGAELPPDCAEDSISFLFAALRKSTRVGRTSLVSHSNHGEFAYRSGPWKLVFKKSGPGKEESRGKPTILELYHLTDDIAEERDLSAECPEVVQYLSEQLLQCVRSGRSRPGPPSANDTYVQFDSIQLQRWDPVPE